MNLRKTPRTLVLTAGYVGLIHVAAGLSLLLRFDGRVPHTALRQAVVVELRASDGVVLAIRKPVR